MKEEKREELKKEAQDLLAQASKLLDKAGKLAEKGGFTLHFGDGGDYVPSASIDLETYREAATAKAQRDGRRDWSTDTVTKWDDMEADEQEELVEELMEELRSDEVPYQMLEYYSDGWEGGWWSPSTC